MKECTALTFPFVMIPILAGIRSLEDLSFVSCLMIKQLSIFHFGKDFPSVYCQAFLELHFPLQRNGLMERTGKEKSLK